MLIYVPLEHIEGRYTVHMDRDIEAYLNAQYGYIPCEDYYSNLRLNNTIGAIAIDFESNNVSKLRKIKELVKAFD